MYPTGYTLPVNTVNQSAEFTSWLSGLRDGVAKAKIIVRVKRLQQGNMGDVKHFDGISEMRIDHGPGVPGLLRQGG